MEFPHFFDPFLLGTELLFTTIAVVFCFLIYFRTRESYELTKYEGIKYFRDAFLFFGLSYVLRFLLSLAFLSRIAFDFIIPRSMFVTLFILPLGYFSTIGIFYLIFSSIWKRFKGKNLLILGHTIAILLSIISFLTRSHLILLLFQSVLLLFGIVSNSIMRKSEKKVSQIRILYLLVSLLWLINLWIIDRPRPLSFEIDIISELVSLAVFVILYYKISKWVR